MPRPAGIARLNRHVSHARDLIAWWPASPSGGRTLVDRGPSGRYHGTHTATGVGWSPSRYGPALDCTGSPTSAGVEVLGSESITYAVPGLTVAVRVRVRSFVGGNAARTVNQGDTNPWGITLESSGTEIRGAIASTSAALTGLSTTVGRWFAAVMTYDGATIRLYADGRVATTARTYGFPVASNVWLANRSAGSRGSNVLIAEALVAARPWTAEEARRWQEDPWTLWAPATTVVDLGAALGGGAGPGFQPAWARGSNVLIGGGVAR